MNTGDMFLCKVCGLPIRNPEELIPADSERFICETCEVCKLASASQVQMESLQKDLLAQLCGIAKCLYRWHTGKMPSAGLMDVIRDKVNKQTNPADDAIDRITKALRSGISDEDLLRQVRDSERTLAGFYYLSGARYTHVNSNTVARHWVATVQRITTLVSKYHNNSQLVLEQISKGRYELGLARLARLIGDNPVAINRTPSFYIARGRDGHLLGRDEYDHVPDLMRETKHMNPRITGYNLTEIIRFAGNAAFITEHDEVIEFRARKNNYLCKYLLKDEIMIFINDLWFHREPKITNVFPLAELVTIYPKRLAARALTDELARGDYLPNCVNLSELTKLLRQVVRSC
jgi:hypothetical protein